MAKKDDTLNAKNLPFDQSGAGLAIGGVTAGNLYAKYAKLAAADDKNSEKIVKNLSRYTTIKNAQNLGPKQAQLFNQFMKTGKKPEGLSDATAMTALDWALREEGRFQQHKPVSLLEKIAGPLLTIGASMIPVIGPYAGAAVGGYMGSRNGGSLLDIALGATGGYLGGRSIANAGGVTGVANNIKNGVGNLFNSGGFSNPGALGVSGANLGLDFASGGFQAAPVAGYGASGLGLTGGSVTSALGGLGTLGAPSAAQYGDQAIGGDPSSLYNPASLSPSAGTSAVDKAIKTARAGLKIAGALDTPDAGQTLMSPGAIGAARPMVPHGVASRPFIPYRYFGPNTNPFMARIT